MPLTNAVRTVRLVIMGRKRAVHLAVLAATALLLRAAGVAAADTDALSAKLSQLAGDVMGQY